MVLYKKNRFVVQKGVLINYKVCKACLIIQPLKSHHCGKCDNCIENYEFHCKLSGSCVGKRNFKNLFFFIFFSLVVCIIIFVLLVNEIVVKIEIKKKEALTTIDNKIINNYKYSVSCPIVLVKNKTNHLLPKNIRF